MRVARVVGGIGRTLIGVGLLLLLFVAYQLWGTSIQEARAQDRLGNEFEAALATTTTTSEPRSGPSGPTTTAPAPPPPIEGDPIAQIRIPKIGVTRYVVEGVGVADLKKAPGHYPMTPLPGQVGNVAIAGHRTTYGQPFYRLNELEPGDEIELQTLQGSFTYVVDGKQVVQPSQTEVLDQTEDARLTLTTCEPRYSARRRLIVTAVLRDDPLPASAPAPTNAPSTDPDDDDPTGQVVLEGAGLSGDPTARWPTFWWGLATALAALVTYVARKRWRRRWLYAIGAPFFFVLLFVFFENVSRLLPANI
ncbi:MAG TPA: class E sortase [Acidimicrobiales bacterium]|nr:class E sortase [Acidimicrobiales bacterium]